MVGRVFSLECRGGDGAVSSRYRELRRGSRPRLTRSPWGRIAPETRPEARNPPEPPTSAITDRRCTGWACICRYRTPHTADRPWRLVPTPSPCCRSRCPLRSSRPTERESPCSTTVLADSVPGLAILGFESPVRWVDRRVDLSLRAAVCNNRCRVAGVAQRVPDARTA